MGRKRARKGQHFLLYFACCLIMLLGLMACGHHPNTWRARQHLTDSRAFMARGNFDAALRETEAVFRLFPRAMADQAHYQIGVICIHPRNQSPNLERSLESFQTIIDGYPNSSLKEEALAWVSILQKFADMDVLIIQLKKKIHEKNTEINNLQAQIDKLKKIDLGIEEEKRKNLPR